MDDRGSGTPESSNAGRDNLSTRDAVVGLETAKRLTKARVLDPELLSELGLWRSDKLTHRFTARAVC